MTRWAIDMTGQRFGRLVVISQAESHRGRTGSVVAAWLCQCDCGQQTTVTRDGLRSGDTKSCGCLRTDGTSNVTHGHRRSPNHGGPSPTYRSWFAMNSRCYNPNNNRYQIYGGRNITVCDRWRHDFAAFLTDLGERPAGTTLDRIDNAVGYEPGNVRWATPKVQQLNRAHGTIKLFDLDDNRIAVEDAAHYLAMSGTTFARRLRRALA